MPNKWTKTGGPFKVELTVDVDGLYKLIENQQYRATHFRPWFERKFVPVFRKVIRAQYRSRGEYGGTPWSMDYSPKYLKWKKQAGFGRTPGVLTGDLKKSLVSNTSDSILEIDDMSIRIGTNVKSAERGFGYAATQQYGADTVKGRYRRGNKIILAKSRRKASRGQRPSESGTKNRIPARPPVPWNIPDDLKRSIGESGGEYIALGTMKRPIEVR